MSMYFRRNHMVSGGDARAMKHFLILSTTGSVLSG